MPLIEWTDDLDVGFDLIDKQHRVLVEMINELYDALMEIRGQEALRKIVNRMVEYATIHFMVEEKHMSEHGYENYEQHKNIHDSFSRKAVDLKNQLSEEGFVLSLDVLNFLRDWLLDHIKGTDREYIPFFRETGFR
jgi:hemerythrin